MRLILGFTTFLRDLFDKSAARSSKRLTLNWALIIQGLALVATTTPTIEPINDYLVIHSLWLLVLFPYIVLLALLAYLGRVITSKEPKQTTLHVLQTPLQYSYPTTLRHISKVLFFTLTIYAIFTIKSSLHKVSSLPCILYGYLVDDTENPKEGFVVNIISDNGSVLTSGLYKTDSRGFYIVKTKSPVSRSSKIRFESDACDQTEIRPLTYRYEVPCDSLCPLFKYYIKNCHE